MLKLIFSLLKNRAGLKNWQLQIGAYLLRKGCGYQIGQIIGEKKLVHQRKKLYKVKVVKDLTFDFGTNQIHHSCVNKIMEAK